MVSFCGSCSKFSLNKDCAKLVSLGKCKFWSFCGSFEKFSFNEDCAKMVSLGKCKFWSVFAGLIQNSALTIWSYQELNLLWKSCGKVSLANYFFFWLAFFPFSTPFFGFFLSFRVLNFRIFTILDYWLVFLHCFSRILSFIFVFQGLQFQIWHYQGLQRLHLLWKSCGKGGRER